MQSGAPNAELQVVSHDQVERTLRLGGLRLDDLEATHKRLDLVQFSLVATAHHKFHPHDPGDAKALLRGPRQLPTGRGQAAEAIDQNVGIKENHASERIQVCSRRARANSELLAASSRSPHIPKN